MPTPLKKTAAEMVAEARARVKEIPARDAIALLDDPAYRFIDIRDIRELQQSGFVPGSFHCPRGMAEFWIDPASPYFKEVFAEEGKTFIIYCAGGMRSALTTALLQDMGLEPVMHIGDGFTGWLDAGGPVARKEPTP